MNFDTHKCPLCQEDINADIREIAYCPKFNIKVALRGKKTVELINKHHTFFGCIRNCVKELGLHQKDFLNVNDPTKILIIETEFDVETYDKVEGIGKFLYYTEDINDPCVMYLRGAVYK